MVDTNPESNCIIKCHGRSNWAMIDKGKYTGSTAQIASGPSLGNQQEVLAIASEVGVNQDRRAERSGRGHPCLLPGSPQETGWMGSAKAAKHEAMGSELRTLAN